MAMTSLKTPYTLQKRIMSPLRQKSVLDTFTVNYGVKGKALGSDAIDSAYADITKWQTTVDLTNYANSLGSEYMNIMLGKPDDEANSTKFFTKEQGDLTVKLSNGTTTTASASDLIPQLTLVYKKTSYNLTVGDAGAATLVLPYETTIPSGVKAYTLSYTSGSEITATEVSTTIPANTPVLINASAGTYTFEATDTKTTKAATPTSGSLTGVWTSTTVPSGSYILYNGTDGPASTRLTDQQIRLLPTTLTSPLRLLQPRASASTTTAVPQPVSAISRIAKTTTLQSSTSRECAWIRTSRRVSTSRTARSSL